MKDDEPTRRQFLGAGLIAASGGLTGCTGVLSRGSDVQDSDGDGMIDSEDYAPRDEAVQRKAQLKGGRCSSPATPSGGTATPSESDTPPGGGGTADRFVDRYERSKLTDLEVVRGSPEMWTLADGIEGRSLRGTGGGSKGEGGRVRYDPDEYSWGGDRRISVRFKANTEYSKHHAQLYVYDGEDRWWQFAAAIPLDLFRFRREDEGELEKVNTSIAPTEVHEFAVTIRGETITGALDGEKLIEYTHSEKIGGGTVGFGIGFERETLYDTLRVEPL